VAKPELGSKRQCLECGAKFFDFNKEPIVCPKCGAIFQAAPLPRSPTRPQQPVAEEVEAEPGLPELVPLEEADPPEEKTPIVEDEVEIEDEGGADDDTFLEEEEQDSDDVSGLIDGDLEEDEEG
jgi:uncharacterized protein (TIGR02300 family)